MDSETRDAFDSISEKLRDHDAQFVGIHEKLKDHDLHFVKVDRRLDKIESRLDGIDVRLDGIDRRLDKIDGRLDDHSEELARMSDFMIEGFNLVYDKIEKSTEETRRFMEVLMEQSRDQFRVFQESGYDQTLRLNSHEERIAVLEKSA